MATVETKKTFLPSCWDDDIRMNALFLDFRPHNVNPNDWNSKMKFWTEAVDAWSGGTNSLTFTLGDLREVFKRKGRYPQGLPVVVAELKKSGVLMTVPEFMASTNDVGWLNWTYTAVVKKPISYTWSYVTNMLYGSSSVAVDDEELINFDQVKVKSEQLLRVCTHKMDSGEMESTVTVADLFRVCRHMFQSANDLELCVLWLKRVKKVNLQREGDYKVVKFSDGQRADESQVTQSDLAIVQLKQVKKQLESQLDSHEADVERYRNEAKSLIAAGSRQQAKLSLQKKRQIEKLMVKKQQSLDNMELLLEKLQDAETNKKVVGAYQAGVDAFKHSANEHGLSLDKIDETMDEVQEALDMQSEIQQALVQPFPSPYHDTENLEDELEELLLRPESEFTPVMSEEGDESLTDNFDKLKFVENVPYDEEPRIMEKRPGTQMAS